MVCIRSDNLTTVACLNKLYSKSPVLLAIISYIWRYAIEVEVDIIAEWVPGSENSQVDWLSRWGGV